jgi:hypothetical protein
MMCSFPRVGVDDVCIIKVGGDDVYILNSSRG